MASINAIDEGQDEERFGSHAGSWVTIRSSLKYNKVRDQQAEAICSNCPYDSRFSPSYSYRRIMNAICVRRFELPTGRVNPHLDIKLRHVYYMHLCNLSNMRTANVGVLAEVEHGAIITV
jgi:hypothetical protein